MVKILSKQGDRNPSTLIYLRINDKYCTDIRKQVHMLSPSSESVSDFSMDLLEGYNRLCSRLWMFVLFMH